MERKIVLAEKDSKLYLEMGGCKLSIEIVDNNINIAIDGDINIGINGEFGLATKNNKICFDTINSSIHMNSRVSKALKDLPESKEYLKSLETERKLNTKKQQEYGLTLKTLKQRISKIEKHYV